MQRYADAANEDWHWFEEVVSYANAKLPHALILSGRCMNDRPDAGDSASKRCAG